MSPHLVAHLGFIYAAVARIEAMKAENQHRLSNGDSIAYGEDAFNAEASHLENLADQARNLPE